MPQGTFGTPEGVAEQFYASAETTFGTMVKPTAADALRVIQTTFTPAQERVNRRDKRNSRSVSERITRKKSAEWSVTTYALPSGTAGTAPDCGALLEALFGGHTNTPATSDVYTLARDISKSFSFHRIYGDAIAESLIGGVVNKGVFRFKGEEECEIELSGPAADWVRTSQTTLTSSAASGATTIVVDDDYSLAVNSVIKIGTEDNSGAGFKVTAWNETTNTATIEAALGSDVSAAAEVVPFFPTPTTTGDPLGCITGSLTLDSDTYYVTEFEITLDNVAKLRNDEFGQETARGYSGSGFRQVTFSGTMYLESESVGGSNKNVWIPGKSESFANVAIVIQAGDTAGDIMKIEMPTAEFDIVPLNVPEEEAITFELSGQGIAPITAESEISMTWQ